MSAVQQDWLLNLSWKKQTVVMTALRSPDTITTLGLKKITIWIRSTVLNNADPLTGFMHSELRELPLFDQIDREWERLPVHTAHHIMLAMQVIAYDHPDRSIAEVAGHFYDEAVYAQHLNPERYEQYNARYTDNPERIEVGTS